MSQIELLNKLKELADKLNEQSGKEGFEIIRNDETGDIDEIMMYCHPDWSDQPETNNDH